MAGGTKGGTPPLAMTGRAGRCAPIGVRRQGCIDRNAVSSDVPTRVTGSNRGVAPSAATHSQVSDRVVVAPGSELPLVCEVDEAMCERRGEVEGSDEVTGVVPGPGLGPRRPEPRDLIVGLSTQLRGQSFSQVVVQILR